MHRLERCTPGGLVLIWTLAVIPTVGVAQAPQPGAVQIDLVERLAAGTLRAVNRKVTTVQGTRGIHLSQRKGNGIAWIEGTDFTQGAIELDVRGRDVFQQSFLGIAFHRRDDSTYDAVYLKLGAHNQGTVGLWTGNGSDGDFSNLRLTPRP